jgi:hypothetical protein
MKNFLLRMLYAVICVVIFLVVFPMFMNVVGFAMAGQVWELIRVLVACIAVVYVLFGPTPPSPW